MLEVTLSQKIFFIGGEYLIIITIEMDIPHHKTKELLQTLVLISEQMSLENGCIRCGFFKDVCDENRYRLIGKWENEDDLNNHLQSEEFNFLFGALSFIKKQPRMRLDVVSSIQGIEKQRTARDRQKRNNVHIVSRGTTCKGIHY
jgi:quinol monooxygenase YgiN